MVRTTTTLAALALMLTGLLLSAGSAQETKTTEEEREYTETKKDGIIYQTYQTKHVPSGKTRNIFLLLGANSGCTPWNPDEMEIRTVKPPEHGTISFINGRSETSKFYQPHLKHCNNRQMPGKWIRYTSEKGYVGPDEFVLFEMYPEGDPYQATYRVMVH
jgi:hypothetical protein